MTALPKKYSRDGEPGWLSWLNNCLLISAQVFDLRDMSSSPMLGSVERT